MPRLNETARAKVNLTLVILGRRADGYHELASLVAFADAGDQVTLDTGDSRADASGWKGHGLPDIVVEGPFGPSIAGVNLIAVAIERALAADPCLTTGRITLDKRLPIAAGIGGGSADAAAVLRLLKRANPAANVDWPAVAARLGADVPVCLANRASFMTGTGERLEAVPELPRLDAVLANPRVPVPADKTYQVFRALAAAPLAAGAKPPPAPGAPMTRADLLAYLTTHGNDLLPAARRIVPAVDVVMEQLAGTGDCQLVRLSGGGPTCFGVYGSREAANAAADELARRNPGWWVTATSLG